ncbi:MAG TPA: hypothetical protein VH165_03645 [Kofleriaceae bacterium]|nr:hypothetical protein [Kofleriaceae bacterium]
MTTHRMWLVVAVLALGGCTDFCVGDQVATVGFARSAEHSDELAACIQHHECKPLCADVFQIDGDVEQCDVTSVMRDDLSTQTGPIAPTVDVSKLRGANLRVVYVPRVQCSSANDVSWSDPGDDDGSCDDGSCDGGSDDGSGDDGSCDDGSCDGGSDNGSGDDGSGDDGSGDDGGDSVRAPSAPHRTAPHPGAAHAHAPASFRVPVER